MNSIAKIVMWKIDYDVWIVDIRTSFCVSFFGNNIESGYYPSHCQHILFKQIIIYQGVLKTSRTMVIFSMFTSFLSRIFDRKQEKRIIMLIDESRYEINVSICRFKSQYQ